MHSRWVIPFICVLSLIFTLSTDLWAAQDFLKFLSKNTWEVIPKREGLPKFCTNLAIEWYLVRDESGKEFVLVLPPDPIAHSQIGAHELAEAIGLHHIPTYPVLVKRGENKIPLLAELATKPGSPITGPHMKHFLPDNQWGVGEMTPFFAPNSNHNSFTEVNDVVIGAKQFLFLLGIGASGITFQSLGTTPHLFVADLLFFNTISDLKWDHLKEVFKQFPFRSMKNLNDADAEVFLEELARFLDRFEYMAKYHMRSIFLPYLDSLVKTRGSPLEGKGNVLESLERRIFALRPLMERYLRDRIGGYFTHYHHLTQKPLPIEALYVPKRIPFFTHDHQTPSLGTHEERKTNARNLLESYYFAPESIKQKIASQWAQELNTEDPILALQKEAHEFDGSLRLVNSETLRPNKQENPFQYFLNRNLETTLILYAANDWEGEAIQVILEEVRHSLPVIPLKIDLARGRYFSVSDYDAIRKVVSSTKPKEIIVVELGGVNEVFKSNYESEGIKVTEIDHHSRGDQNGWKPYSSIEQLADHLGYQLSLSQFATGLQDRAGAFGFKQFGWNSETLQAFLSKRPGWNRVARIRENIAGVFGAVDNDVIAVVRGYDDTFGPLNLAVSLETYPKVPHLVIVRPKSVVLSGRPDVLAPFYEDIKRDDYIYATFGGDYGGNLMVNMNARNGMAISQIADLTLRKLNDSPRLIHPCVIELLSSSIQADR